MSGFVFMSGFRKSLWYSLLVLLFVANYSSVCFIACLAHNHESDIHLHDNCPACQWDVQSQDDFSEANAILNAIDDPLDFIGYKPLNQIVILPKENFGFPHLARAPPSLV